MLKSNWNYRIIRSVEDEQETFTIREVYYQDGTPELCTIRSEFPMSTDDIAGLQHQIDAYQQAMTLPVLDYTLFTLAQPTETQQ